MKQYKRNLLVLIALLVWLIPIHNVFAQQAQINGYITDRSTRPIANAIVSVVEDSEITTTTDKDGRFSIKAKEGQHLNVITNGLTQTTVAVIPVSMKIIIDSNENVPIGYGDTRSAWSLTSAVGMAGTEDLENNLVQNAEDALYGLIPGLTVLQNGGTPPISTDMYIRGRGTFNNSTPLVLIDGFEKPFTSEINFGGISVDEIENVILLKDAAALARYGQRGANGVLLITTKRGNTEGLQVDASVSGGFTQPTELPSFVEGPVYARAINEALTNDGEDPRYSSADIEDYDSGNSPRLHPNINWYDEVLRDAGNRTKYNVNFRGGGDRARYFALLNIVNDSGIFGPVNENADYSTQLKYSRLNFRSNLDINLRDDLLLKLDVTGNIVERNLPNRGSGPGQIFSGLYSIPSGAFPVRTPSGNWGGTQTYGNNPVAILTNTGYGQPNSRQYSLTGMLEQDFSKILEGLGIEIGASYMNYGSFNERYDRGFSYESISPIRDQSGTIVDTSSTVYGENTDLAFNDSFGNMRIFSDYFGEVNYQTSNDNSYLEGKLFFHQSERIFEGQNNTYRRQNLAASVHLNLTDKYLFDVTASYSGNNHLEAGNRFNFFPAVSAAWILSEENLFQDINSVDFLKLRASWGISGNDLIPTNKPYMQTYDRAAGYWFTNSNSDQGGFTEGRLATANYTVETAYKSNIGIDIGLFDKLDLTTDLFYERRTNILSNTEGSISDVIGVAKPLETDGIVDNRGIEVEALWKDRIGKFGYHLGGQLTYARNEIVEMNEQFRPHDYLRRTGKPVGQTFGLEAIGFFEDQEDIENSPTQVFSGVQSGDIKYRDQNGDGIINEYDEIALGYSTALPEIYYSFNLGLNYGGFDISALFQGTGNYNAYLNTQSVYWPLRDNSTISDHYYENRWTPETSGSATYPRLTTENVANNFRPNSIWIVDRSYLKLRKLEVNYTLPDSFVNQMRVEKIRISVWGTNLFSIDNIAELDPEHLTAGYPILRTYNLGIDISF
ncbi:MAG: SusC/RagA family TonB-linked outer membrane protein [Balneolaceae bacterium]